MFQATSCFYKVNPLLQRSEQIRVNAAHHPSLRTAARSLRSNSNDLYICIHIYIFVSIFFPRVSCEARLRVIFPPSQSCQGFHIIARISHLARSLSSSNTPVGRLLRRDRDTRIHPHRHSVGPRTSRKMIINK